MIENYNGFGLLNSVEESLTGYSCPNCNERCCGDETMISKSRITFKESPDPHYSWYEIHKCQKCETLYLLHNGT